eukprot:TRINITY_DN11119_c4_g1_i1.p1 TRINITY_DN11119_c4_g1~~TRINITY_DN11119_c4_g1_i1.p1  ORF type:complete len:690 (+),score=129.29 TRINITY_DN11119_c4_g1_i1:48-2117(+)
MRTKVQTLLAIAATASVSVVNAAPCGGMACDADMPDADEFVKGMSIPAFSVPVENGWYEVNPAVNRGRGVVVMGYRETDPFTTNMLTSGTSLEKFLTVEPLPADVDFIFAAWNNASFAQTLKSLINAKMQALKLPAATQNYWRSHMLYATKSIEEMYAMDPSTKNPTKASTNVLKRILDSPSFHSIGKQLTLTTGAGEKMTIDRLDGFFQFTNTQDLHNHSPVNPMEGAMVRIDETIICTSAKPADLSKKFAFVNAAHLSPSCSFEKAILWFAGSNVQAVVFMEQPGTKSLSVIGENIQSDDESGFFTVGSTVKFNQELANLFPSPGVSISCLFEYVFHPGQYFSVTADNTLRQIGSPINPYLAVVSWEMQFLQYLSGISRTKLNAYSIPLIVRSVGNNATTGKGAPSSATLPPKTTMDLFNRAQLEIKFGCLGNGDFECPVWDRIAELTIDCSLASVPEYELGRWITPYRRSDGHWFSDISTLYPLFKNGGDCTLKLSGFSMDMVEPWVTDVTLHLQREEGVKSETLTPLFTGGTYDVTYNNRTAMVVKSPAAGTTVGITAVITGHGLEEFQSTRHHFSVNGVVHTISFMDPEDKWGCTKHVSTGVEPNGFGAWWFGRDGWCNGHNTPPIVTDVTHDLNPTPGSSNTITYSSQYYDDTTKSWKTPDCKSGCGYIVMSSSMTFSTAFHA